METLRAWALSACAVAVVCTVLYRLFPENSLGRQGRLLLPCLFLLALFTPLAGVDLDFSAIETPTVSTADTAAMQARLEQQTVAYVNDTLLAMTNQALVSYKVQAKKVTADINFTAEGGIELGQITVYIDKADVNMAAVARQVTEHRLGTAVVLATWEESGQ